MSESLRQRAIRLLAQREHSRSELARKLAGHGSEEEVAMTLDTLERESHLSDRRFAEAYVASRAARHGAVRLRHDLQERGVAGELIAEALAGVQADEAQRARAIWQRRFGEAPRDAREFARQARFLQGRGFSAQTVRRILRGGEP